MKSFVKRNEDKGIKRKKLFLDRKKAIIRNELYVKIIRTTSKQDTTKGDKDYMCGFAGFVGEVENREEVLENMMNTIIHRGPDSEGKYVDEDAALGFRRLSIIDLSEVGDQPLYNEDRSKVLVFNGEIYNYQELRKELVEAGHVFVSNTDSETLIHGLVFLQLILELWLWDSLIKQQQQFLSSVELMDQHPSSLQVNCHRLQLWDQSR